MLVLLLAVTISSDLLLEAWLGCPLQGAFYPAYDAFQLTTFSSYGCRSCCLFETVYESYYKTGYEYCQTSIPEVLGATRHEPIGLCLQFEDEV
jgi:hypothetical protein